MLQSFLGGCFKSCVYSDFMFTTFFKCCKQINFLLWSVVTFVIIVHDFCCNWICNKLIISLNTFLLLEQKKNCCDSLGFLLKLLIVLVANQSAIIILFSNYFFAMLHFKILQHFYCNTSIYFVGRWRFLLQYYLSLR